MLPLAIIVFTAAALLFVPTDSASAASEHGTCEEVSVEVALAPGQPANKHVSGTFCAPEGWTGGERQVDVLVHGASYDRQYWDFGYDYPQYSYVDRALQQERATFAFDRLGVGQSSRPPSALATIDANAHVLHQVIDWLRTEKAVADITLIGHSIGSITAIEESAKHNDADRLVLTGLLHTTKPTGVLEVGAAFYPAMLDSQFFGTIFDPGYFTTMPGRRDAFYSSAADPAVIAYDSAHKAVASAVTISGGLTQIIAPAHLNKSQQITLPVMLQTGEHDGLFCDGILGVDCSSEATVEAHEAPYYPNAASLTTNVIPDTGHDLTLHPSAGESFDALNSWIESY